MRVIIPEFNQLNLLQKEHGLCIRCKHFVEKSDWSVDYICRAENHNKADNLKCDKFDMDEYTAYHKWEITEENEEKNR